MRPRGFFSPEISVSRACSVPIPPPPMPAIPPNTKGETRSFSSVEGRVDRASRASSQRVSSLR